MDPDIKTVSVLCCCSILKLEAVTITLLIWWNKSNAWCNGFDTPGDRKERCIVYINVRENGYWKWTIKRHMQCRANDTTTKMRRNQSSTENQNNEKHVLTKTSWDEPMCSPRVSIYFNDWLSRRFIAVLL